MTSAARSSSVTRTRSSTSSRSTRSSKSTSSTGVPMMKNPTLSSSRSSVLRTPMIRLSRRSSLSVQRLRLAPPDPIEHLPKVAKVVPYELHPGLKPTQARPAKFQCRFISVKSETLPVWGGFSEDRLQVASRTCGGVHISPTWSRRQQRNDLV